MRRLLFGAALAAACLITSPVYADLIDVDKQACGGKADGDKCIGDSGREGVCRPGRCCKLDYSNGTPPETKCTECLTCDRSAPAKAPEQAAEAPAPTTQAPPAEPAKAEQTTKSGCAAAGLGGTSLLSLSMGATFLFNLRRRRRPTPTESP